MTGPEIQSYTGAILAALFLVIVPLYSALASRVDRMRLINSVTMFFVVTLVAFYFVSQLSLAPTLVAVTFFLWVGVFNLMIIAQFWSFANDLYTPDQENASSPSSDSADRLARSEGRSSRAT